MCWLLNPTGTARWIYFRSHPEEEAGKSVENMGRRKSEFQIKRLRDAGIRDGPHITKPPDSCDLSEGQGQSPNVLTAIT